MKPVTHKHLIEHELEGFGIRCNKQPVFYSLLYSILYSLLYS